MIRTLLVNTGSNVLVMFVKLAITFIMTPIFVHNLGKYDYGLWEMIGAVIGYMGILDLGLRPAISRYAAKHLAEQDEVALQSVYVSAFAFMAIVGVLLFLFFFLWGIWFSGSLSPAGDLSQKYTLFLVIIGAYLFISFPGYVAESYLEGFQKYYLKNNITIVNSIIGSTLLYTFITPENGLLLLAAINGIGISIKYILFIWILSRPAYGAIKVQAGNYSWLRLKELVVFGFKSFVQGIASRVENATDVLVIGFIMGPAMVPFYSIPANLAQQIRTMGWTLTHAFMPLFSGLSAKAEDDMIRRVFVMSSRYVVSILFGMGTGALMLGVPFISVWLDSEFGNQARLIIVFLIFFTILPFINPFSSRYLTAINKHGIFAKFTPIAAIMNIGLSLALVHPFGLEGVAFASLVPGLIFVPLYLRYTCRHLGLPVWEYLRGAVLPAFVPAGIMALILLGVGEYLIYDSYADIVAGALLSSLAWLVAFWLLVLNREERTYLCDRIARIAGRK
ncbi:oligosaccharide flippase family protein [Marinobacter nauticus]|uniref:O-antigen/teichoic acid export membrane protein n=1 Tax=Marinobacter nauticus TaxID=2743 RepID=A0A368UWJ2_MARNT|nr:oligosaccharide flippase family protein [Marinobacter nauticus]RBP71955.1 O-antigen/teichoic acid export membrane protein [Marinobacter nauticus]RCW32973.1 O-antigen/teichoic acid export membrane protein [Marinobacter nauticus]